VLGGEREGRGRADGDQDEGHGGQGDLLAHGAVPSSDSGCIRTYRPHGLCHMVECVGQCVLEVFGHG
jgi:hypothetical protein